MGWFGRIWLVFSYLNFYRLSTYQTGRIFSNTLYSNIPKREGPQRKENCDRQEFCPHTLPIPKVFLPSLTVSTIFWKFGDQNQESVEGFCTCHKHMDPNFQIIHKWIVKIPYLMRSKTNTATFAYILFGGHPANVLSLIYI